MMRHHLTTPAEANSVLVFCPDARPPAYELVQGLAERGLLHRFVTGYHYKPGIFERLTAAIPATKRLHAGLKRRIVPGVDLRLIERFPSYDLLIRAENQAGRCSARLRTRLAEYRTDRFDRQCAEAMPRWSAEGAKVALFFSDVGSEFAMAAAKRCGMKVVLSMVTGHMDEEIEVLNRERQRVPDFYPLYLGDGSLDMDELKRLHDRRRRDLEQSDLVLVPSNHIAGLVETRSDVPADKIRVIPYAANVERFTPASRYATPERCRFLFAGGITQRKGLSDLLTAWRQVRRTGWSLTLAGEAPRRALDKIPEGDPSIEMAGRVAYADMPRLMASHDVFVFPTLFEGSAVVCYEALASGLPVITTPQAGSVVRHDHDGLIVPAADSEALAAAMLRLGGDTKLRDRFAASARQRALEHTWHVYRDRTIAAVRQTIVAENEASQVVEESLA
ncbi:glycosyltransferase [bacterium]|nr:glycosyltransferase [bacterium]